MKTKLLLFVFSLLLFASCEGGSGKYTVWTGEDQYETFQTELLDGMTFYYDTTTFFEVQRADEPMVKPSLSDEDLEFYNELPIGGGTYVVSQLKDGEYIAYILSDKEWKSQIRPYLQSTKRKTHLWGIGNVKRWLIDNNFEPTQRANFLSSFFAQKNHRMIVYRNGDIVRFLMK